MFNSDDIERENECLCCIMLQQALGYSNKKAFQLLKKFKSGTSIFSAEETELEKSCIVNKADIAKLQNVSIGIAKRIIDQCSKVGITCVCITDDSYPSALKELFNPPIVLYCYGDVSLLNDDSLFVSIVGTRKSSEYGNSVSFQLGKTLSICNAVTVSGGAMGIDSASHYGSLSVTGKTVMVLGCGFCDAPKRIAELIEDIVDCGGLIISEYAPYEHAGKFTFPARNRIISGLSDAVVIVEAGENSGALITASHALDQNKDVYVVPGNVSSLSFQGSNSLIRDGAVPIFCTDDLLKFYYNKYENLSDVFEENKEILLLPLGLEKNCPDTSKKQQRETKSEDSKIDKEGSTVIQIEKSDQRKPLNKKESDLLQLFDKDVMSEEDLVNKTDLTISEFLSTLNILEIKGYIENEPGGKFRKK